MSVGVGVGGGGGINGKYQNLHVYAFVMTRSNWEGAAMFRKIFLRKISRMIFSRKFIPAKFMKSFAGTNFR